MSDPALVRSVALLVPLGALFVAAAYAARTTDPGRATDRARTADPQRPDGPPCPGQRPRPAVLASAGPTERDRAVAGALVATAWNLLGLIVLNACAPRLGWWDFSASGGLLLGVPVDLWLGWALLWGAVPALALHRLPVVATLALFAWLDLMLMPLAAPVVRLQPGWSGWLGGEAVAVAGCLLPGLLLGRWTREDRMLRARLAAQMLLAGGLGLGLVPAVTWEATGAGLGPALEAVDRLPGWALALAPQVLALALLPGVAAAIEFAVRGRGTPIPYDPPRRLVTTGPYAYVRNPMQLSMVLAYAVLGATTHSGWLLAGAAVAAAYGTGFAAWHEGGQLADRFGPSWMAYRAAVRPWVPRIRPWPGVPGTPPARLYVAGSCEICRGIGGWLARRRPVALQLVAAERRPELRRITYETADGYRAQGVPAFARALGHLHLGWAIAGWWLGMPGVWWLVQCAADAFGPAPQGRPAPTRPDPTGAARARHGRAARGKPSGAAPGRHGKV